MSNSVLAISSEVIARSLLDSFVPTSNGSPRFPNRLPGVTRTLSDDLSAGADAISAEE